MRAQASFVAFIVASHQVAGFRFDVPQKTLDGSAKKDIRASIPSISISISKNCYLVLTWYTSIFLTKEG
jgi:hypothetical protein